MKRIGNNQGGFIPLLITVLLIVGSLIYLVYTRVHNAQNWSGRYWLKLPNSV